MQFLSKGICRAALDCTYKMWQEYLREEPRSCFLHFALQTQKLRNLSDDAWWSDSYLFEEHCRFNFCLETVNY